MTHKARVVMVGYNVAPSQMLTALADAWSARKNSPDLLSRFFSFGGKHPLYINTMTEAARRADLVIAGISPPKEEYAAAEIVTCRAARDAGIPFALISDTFGNWAWSVFEELRESASLVSVVTPNETNGAQKLFPNSRVIAPGNPLWEDFFTPKAARNVVREALGLSDGDFVVLCPGGKDLTVNILHFGGVIDAAKMLDGIVLTMKKYVNADEKEKCRKIKIILALHPGDPNLPGSYELLGKTRVPAQIVTKAMMPSSKLLAGADIVAQSISTIGIEAACLRIPVIDYLTEAAWARHETVTGVREWPLCKLGVSRLVESGTRLASALQELAQKNIRPVEEMRARQEAAFPKPKEKGAVANAMIDAFEECIRASS